MNAVLNVFALLVIFFLIIAFAAVIVVLGSLPGKIALKRGHPHPDAVNVASWIGPPATTREPHRASGVAGRRRGTGGGVVWFASYQPKGWAAARTRSAAN